MQEKKNKALKRLEESEQKVMIDRNGEAATLKRAESIAQYKALLDLESGLTDRQKEFLVEYIQSGIILRACLNINMARDTHRRWLNTSERYAECFQDATEMANEKLELLAYDLASGVYSKPLVSLGAVVGYEQIYDTKMLDRLLKARMPERFTERKDITSNGHSIVKLVDKEAWDSV
jgi:hypothetical protein